MATGTEHEPAGDADGARLTRHDAWLVACMLDGLAFPASHWQLVAQAELNGVDAATHDRLRRLPVRPYESSADVAWELVRHNG